MSRHAILGQRSIELESDRVITLMGGATGVVESHALLGPKHSDTVTAAPTRGGLIYGNATPAWDLLPLGASGRYLRSDGTDLAWATIQAGDLPSHTHSHDTDLTDVSANDHHNQVHVLAGTSGLGADHTVSGLTAGQVLRATGATTARFQTLQAGDLPALRGTPALTFSTSNDPGSATTYVATDATIALFDGTNPTQIDAGDTASPGSSGKGARHDHAHAVNSTADGETNVSTLLQSDANGYLRLARLGLGTAPSYPLDIYSSSAAVARLKGVGDASAYCYLDLWSDEATDKRWSIQHRVSPANEFLVQYYDGAGYYHPIRFQPLTTANPVLYGHGDGRLSVGHTTSYGFLDIRQMTTNGPTLNLYRNQGSGSTDSPVLRVVQDDASDDQATVYVQQDGTGEILQLYQGTSKVTYVTNEGYVRAPRIGIGKDPAVELDVQANNATATMRLRQDGGGDLLELYSGSTYVGQFDSHGCLYLFNTTETSESILRIRRNKTSANTSAYVVFFGNDAGGDDKGVLQINNYGAAPALYVLSYSAHEAIQAWRNQGSATEPVVRISQYHASAGTPVLELRQTDVDQSFLHVIGTAASGDLTRSLVDYGDESGSTAQVWIKVFIEDLGNQVTDQAVYLLGYTLA